jgi:hypothetical protein
MIPSHVYPKYDRNLAKDSNPDFSERRTITGAVTMTSIKMINRTPALGPNCKTDRAFMKT